MSASQISFGFAAAKSRSTTLGATGKSWFESVVLTRNFLCEIARIPSPFMIFATAFTEQEWPRATNSACIRGEPYRFFTALWIARISAANSSRRFSLTLGCRSTQS